MAETAILHHVLSDRRSEMLFVIHGFQAEFGFCPTVREVQVAVGLASVSTVHAHLGVLRDAHLVDWREGFARTLRLTDLGRLYVL